MKRDVVSEMPDLPRETIWLKCPRCHTVIPHSQMSDTEARRLLVFGRDSACDGCNTEPGQPLEASVVWDERD